MKGIRTIGIGGGIGAIARYAVAICAEKFTPVKSPFGTLAANLLGCQLIGFFWSSFERVHISREFRLFLFTGILGGFITFPPLHLSLRNFFKADAPLHAISYLLISNLLGISMVALGLILSQRITR